MRTVELYMYDTCCIVYMRHGYSRQVLRTHLGILGTRQALCLLQQATQSTPTVGSLRLTTSDANVVADSLIVH